MYCVKASAVAGIEAILLCEHELRNRTKSDRLAHIVFLAINEQEITVTDDHQAHDFVVRLYCASINFREPACLAE